MSNPSDKINVGFLCYPDEDSDPDGMGIVGALGTPRATAAGRYARAYGYDFREVTCVKRYIRIWTRQDAWDHLLYGGLEKIPPADWEVPDGCPAYEFVGPHHPNAEPVWLCEA